MFEQFENWTNEIQKKKKTGDFKVAKRNILKNS